MPSDSEELIRAIIEWSHGRPYWERCALGLLARGETIEDQQIGMLADVAEGQADGASVNVKFGTLEDFSSGSDEQEPVRIIGLADLEAVNAITDGSSVTFEPSGITLVYGENGSGKSGYARILKLVTRSRHKTDVLTNVFRPPAAQSARLQVLCGTEQLELDWPRDTPEFLSRTNFYDSACSASYVTIDTEVAYRPRAIAFLDELVQLAVRVRGCLTERRNAAVGQLPELPSLSPGSSAAAFASTLSAETESQDIEKASELAPNVDEQLSELRRRIVNLESDNLDKKRLALVQLGGSLAHLEKHIASGRDQLSEEQMSALREAKSAADTARAAADAASVALFSSEPVRGVGTESWRILWEAARRFSEEEAYPDGHFPVRDTASSPSRCVLCHQELSTQASARLHAFDEFVAADSERVAKECAAEFESLAGDVRRFTAFDTEIQLSLQRIEGADDAACTELSSELEALDNRHAKLVEVLHEGAIEVEPLPPLRSRTAVAALKQASTRQLADLDTEDQLTQLTNVCKEEAEIQGRIVLHAARTAIENRVACLRRISTVDKAIKSTETSSLTRKAADFTRVHVSKAMKERFERETSEFGLNRVKLVDAGGRHGNLRHRSQLMDTMQSAPLEDILSEGEQSALGLAGFLTEVETDLSMSAVILDDPVTSLDHVRQERVARRIVDLAKERQVIVFTHSIAFAVDLKRAADASSVDVAERYVWRSSSHVGAVVEGSPWTGKTIDQRRNELEKRIASLMKMHGAGDLAKYEEDTRSWYQDLRLVWELAIEEVLLGPVQVRGSLEMRPSNLKIIARFTEVDDSELQAAFILCGDRGSHDRSAHLGRPLPEIAELKKHLADLKSWCGRIRSYRKKLG